LLLLETTLFSLFLRAAPFLSGLELFLQLGSLCLFLLSLFLELLTLELSQLAGHFDMIKALIRKMTGIATFWTSASCKSTTRLAPAETLENFPTALL